MDIGEEVDHMSRVPDSCPLMDMSGNCIPIGRFCTSIDDKTCNDLILAYKQGKHDGDFVDLSTKDANKILVLPKKQIPIKPICFEHGRTRNKYECGNCGSSEIFKEWEYCPWCGQAIKWND